MLRYPAEISPFAAFLEETPTARRELREVAGKGPVALLYPERADYFPASAQVVKDKFEKLTTELMILLEATLSFLGLGVQPPTPTWGGMINDGRKYIAISWSVSLFPGIAIALLILACNLVGDALRDALDPTLRDD